jgi:hypothetical protein
VKQPDLTTLFKFPAGPGGRRRSAISSCQRFSLVDPEQFNIDPDPITINLYLYNCYFFNENFEPTDNFGSFISIALRKCEKWDISHYSITPSPTPATPLRTRKSGTFNQ